MQKQRPSVSVVIPTFNRGDLLINAIESVLSQTYHDYEIIVVDDGSTDDTRFKLGSYIDRIQYVYQENRGASAAQNFGIQLAKGEWVSILASDDTWLPNKLELQIQAIKEMGKEFGACFTNCTFVGDPCRKVTTFEEAGFRPPNEMGVLEDPVKWVLARYPIFWFQSLMIKRNLLLESEGFDSRMIVAEDTDLLFRLSFMTKFCFVNHPLVNIDIVPDRTDRLTKLSGEGDERAFISKEIMFEKWRGLTKEKPNVSLRREIDGLLRQNYYQWLRQCITRFELAKVFRIVSKMQRCGVGFIELCSYILRAVLSGGVRRIKGEVRHI